MQGDADAAVPHETDELLDQILTRYHQVHRAELADLQPLAEKVEAMHEHPYVPRGMANALCVLAREMEDHTDKDKVILFPVMRAGGVSGIERPIALMRADHEDHDENIALIRQLTNDLAPPEHGCVSWRALYTGTEQLLSDLAAHIALENDVLFPRFERQ